MAPRLSNNKVEGNRTRARSFDNSNFTHYSSAVATVIALYSASVKERATVRCFIVFQEISTKENKKSPR